MIRLAGFSGQGRDSSISFPICRKLAQSPPTWYGRGARRASRFCGRLRRNIIRICWKSRRFAGPPTGRLFGEGATFMVIPPYRPKFIEIATYLGAKWRNSTPHDSVVDCVEISSRNPEKSRLLAGPSPGRFFGEWGAIQRNSATRSKFSETSTY